MLSLQPGEFQVLNFGTVDVSDFVVCDPPVALQVTVNWNENVNSDELSHQLSRMMGLISQQEKHLGGMGMVLDADECEVSLGQVMCLLRFLDLRGSAGRGKQLSEIVVQADPSNGEPFPGVSFLEPLSSIVNSRFPHQSSGYKGEWKPCVSFGDKVSFILEPSADGTPSGVAKMIKARVDTIQADVPNQPAALKVVIPEQLDEKRKSNQIAVQVFHAIDEEASKNAERVEQRDQSRQSDANDELARQQIALTGQALEQAMRDLHERGIKVSVELKESVAALK